LYALSGVVLHLVLRRCLNPSFQITSFLNVPFICSMLYIAHPIHTEAVANIKGRDEILCVLALLLTLYLFLKNHDLRGWRYYVAGLMVFFLALLSKENASTFVVVIPLTLYFSRDVKTRELTIAGGGLILVAGLYAFLRQACVASSGESEIKEILNNPFVHASLSEKYATIANILGRYLQLLLLPHPLSHDYYYNQIPLIPWTSASALFPFALYCALAVYAVTGIRGKSVLAYSILFYLVTISIVSNVVISVGTTLSERFL
jgi:protein O-mannosyl-transferase